MTDSPVSCTLGINMHLHVCHKWTLLIRSHIFALNANNPCCTRTDFYLNFFFQIYKVVRNREAILLYSWFLFPKADMYNFNNKNVVSCHKWIKAVCPNSCLMLADKMHGAVDHDGVKFTLFKIKLCFIGNLICLLSLSLLCNLHQSSICTYI